MSNDPQGEMVDLLNRAREGDPDARDRLFDTCRNHLNLLARQQLGPRLKSKVDASDVVQQTLLEAHRDLAAFDGQSEGEWQAWLRAILGATPRI